MRFACGFGRLELHELSSDACYTRGASDDDVGQCTSDIAALGQPSCAGHWPPAVTQGQQIMGNLVAVHAD